MPPRMPEYRRPADVTGAATLLREAGPSAALLDLPLRPRPLEQIAAETLVDLRRLDLATIAADERLIRIGAQTPIQTLLESDVIRAYAGGLLAEAARIAAPLHMRNAATVGAAFMAVDGPPEVKLALLALDAVEEYDETRQLLLGMSLPSAPPEGLGAALERVARAPRDEAIVSVAARLRRQAGVARDVRLAIAGATPQPQRCEPAERLAEGQTLTPAVLQRVQAAAADAAVPNVDFRADAAYRRAMAGVLAARALAVAWQRALA